MSREENGAVTPDVGALVAELLRYADPVYASDNRHLIAKRAAEAATALQTESDRAEREEAGWLFHNPDAGTELSESHPVESGEVPDATDIRRATARELLPLLIEAWADEARARMRTALKFYANPEVYKPHPHGPAFDNRDLSFVARAALSGEKP